MVDGQSNGKRNTVGTDFVSCDRLARRSESVGKLFWVNPKSRGPFLGRWPACNESLHTGMRLSRGGGPVSGPGKIAKCLFQTRSSLQTLW